MVVATPVPLINPICQRVSLGCAKEKFVVVVKLRRLATRTKETGGGKLSTRSDGGVPDGRAAEGFEEAIAARGGGIELPTKAYLDGQRILGRNDVRSCQQPREPGDPSWQPQPEHLDDLAAGLPAGRPPPARRTPHSKSGESKGAHMQCPGRESLLCLTESLPSEGVALENQVPQNDPRYSM